MKKTFIFTTKGGKYERTLRGTSGTVLMEKLRDSKEAHKITPGQIVTTIETIFTTKEELDAIMDA